ncbi:tryptophan-rich sensory protein [Candidatus Saccharibacteria bacterium]|nr:tryptophan-rich sensory protein [Candidatus Saccharibacteria bacterium]
MARNDIKTVGKVWRIWLAIAIPLGGGLLVSLFTRDAMGQFNSLEKPFLAPPDWLFPVAWTILYILMGLASYYIWHEGHLGKKKQKVMAKTALWFYGIQLVFNFAWTIVFFNLGWYWAAFVLLLVMWMLEIALVILAGKMSKAALWCLIPYLLWTTFAGYLNLMIAILN